MLIGEFADVMGLPTETIRYYERRALIQEPARAANGYRNYDESTLARLCFIRSAQAAGLALAEIAGIVETRDAGTAPCTHVAELLAAKLDGVRDRQQQLAALETEIEALLERSHHLDPADCTDTEICHILNVGP
ncbi:MAG: heavy metal-responsive transcriptional regulator [Acidimicrobiales bacterium]